MKIYYLFRNKPRSFSIERVFGTLIESLPPELKAIRHVVPCEGASWPAVLRNWNDCRKLARSAILHVTGDIHYCAILPGRRVVLTVHDLGLLNQSRGFKRWLKWLLWGYLPGLFAKRILCISEKTKVEWLRLSHCNPEKVRVLYNPISLDFQPVPKPFADVPTILHFAGYRNKNTGRLVEALAGIPCRLRLLGCSPSGEELALLQAKKIDYTLGLELSNQQIIEEYRRCDLVCFPSTYEGFGMPIIEAQKIGRPVITSRLAPMDEVGGDGAYYVDPFSIGSIRAGILKIIKDQNVREQLVAAGFANVRRFEPQSIASLLTELYHEL